LTIAIVCFRLVVAGYPNNSHSVIRLSLTKLFRLGYSFKKVTGAQGFAFLTSVIVIYSSVQLSMIGIIGEYLANSSISKSARIEFYDFSLNYRACL
jgi:hypothetical protein